MDLENWFYIDSLSIIIMILIGFVGICVLSFAWRYLGGDRKKTAFYAHAIMLMVFVFIMVSANHMGILWGAFILSNYALIRLILHKKQWAAAKQSSILAQKYLFSGGALFGVALILLSTSHNTYYVQILLKNALHTPLDILALMLIFATAMIQSSIIPFHKWLISSINAPTPVSALMHAGIINGGGFLLARFASAYLQNIDLLNLIFIFGLITSILGTLWKLMQPNIKSTLACSTIGQMGFMFVQCGLGLFPAAIAHLFWHGLFKASLFLGSGSAAKDKSFNTSPPTFIKFIISIVFGIMGAGIFTYISGKTFTINTTSIFLIVLSGITSAQCALSILETLSIKRIVTCLFAVGLGSCLYGFNIYAIEYWLGDLYTSIQLNVLHVFGLFVLMAIWAFKTCFKSINIDVMQSKWMTKLYVMMMNFSQPHPKTITPHRNAYQY